jgi:hypothetical protein
MRLAVATTAALGASLLPDIVAGAGLKFEVHHAIGSASNPRLRSRADISSNSTTTGDNGIPIRNTQNAFYLTNITVRPSSHL